MVAPALTPILTWLKATPEHKRIMIAGKRILLINSFFGLNMYRWLAWHQIKIFIFG
jgi:hypothetical protein